MDTAQTPTPAAIAPPRHRRWRNAWRIPVLLAAALLLWNGCANWLVTREERNTPRDADTGIILGAEPKDLGPADAKGAVLFVHGFIGSGQNFDDLPQRVAEKGWRVRVMLLPGHGTSPRDFARTTPDELVAAVKQELDALHADYETVVVVGHSMGGTLLTLEAAEQRVDKLILVAPYFGITYNWFYIVPPERGIRWTAPVVRWVYKGNMFTQVNREEAKDDIQSYRWVPSRGSVALLELGDRVNAPGVLERVACPVLVLHSHNDVAASGKAAQKAFDRVGSEQKEIRWFDRSNHHMIFDYDGEAVKTAIVEFIGDPPVEK